MRLGYWWERTFYVFLRGYTESVYIHVKQFNHHLSDDIISAESVMHASHPILIDNQ